jgi:hypothetical protein
MFYLAIVPFLSAFISVFILDGGEDLACRTIAHGVTACWRGVMVA